MILIDIEIYNHSKKRYELFEAIVDTGATFCAIAKHIADETGIPFHESTHLWQVNGPLTLTKTKLKIRYRETEHQLDGVIVNISQNYLRSATQDEKCKRPLTPHPLSSRIIVGKNFLEKLSQKEKKEILSYLIL
ncbi:MAG: hypothetical protein QMD13_02760 [Candidatus Bathyarchaeia archaeon]|nr:hypothetical protein [Candidatus Bathyarchaeia archaeon]MDI6904401.1 hypothetical protein [Candidatus Bathyarchaeia archaeon]